MILSDEVMGADTKFGGHSLGGCWAYMAVFGEVNVFVENTNVLVFLTLKVCKSVICGCIFGC